jgi:hypothetical protein
MDCGGLLSHRTPSTWPMLRRMIGQEFWAGFVDGVKAGR